jgi:hypothetical protein
VLSEDSISAMAPAAVPATVDVTVTTRGGTSATGADVFTFVGEPTITAIAPAIAPASDPVSGTRPPPRRS